MAFDNFSGYVLAGGQSSRMKTDKAFLEIGGETFLTHAVKTLQTVGENRVKVVLNQTQKHFVARIPDDVPHIFDIYENRGALGGIHAALTDCQTKYALILAVDLPFVSGEAVSNLADITLSSNKYIAVVPNQTSGEVQPLCAVYHARYCLPALENLMSENESASVKDFLELIAPRYINQNKLTADDSTDIFFNVNHPADYKQIA